MPTKNQRINVAVENRLYQAVHQLATKEGVSMSLMMRDLVKEAIELREDQALSIIAAEREKSFKPDKSLSHKEVWS